MQQSAFQKHYQKPAFSSKLNLVALMDIFTILVFFLLLNSGEAEKLENAKFVELPDSHASTSPHNDLVIMIDDDGIWLGGDRLVSLDNIGKRSGSGSVPPSSIPPSIPELSGALAAHRERKGELNSYEQENGLALTIMGDRDVSYGLLKTVMATARLENFRDISLAVNRIAAPTPRPGGTAVTSALADGAALPPSPAIENREGN